MSDENKIDQEAHDAAQQQSLGEKNESPSPFTSSSSDEADDAARMSEILRNAAIKPKTEDHKTVPGEVKLATLLLIVHGVCLALNGVLYAQREGDWSSAPQALIWLGVTIVLGGALLDRQQWAWWVTTLLGGIIGVGNFLAAAGYFVGSRLGAIEGASFIVPVIAVASIAMLACVTLLMISSVKAAFGMGRKEL